MDFKTDENGQVSMDLETKRQIERPAVEKAKKIETAEPEEERPVICPQGSALKDVVQLVKGEAYCRERCGKHYFNNSYEAMRVIYDCIWIKRKATGYGSEAATRSG